MADGSIRINTKLDNKGISKDLNDFSNMAKRTASNIKRAFTGKNNLEGLKQEIKDTEKIIKDSQKEIDNYQKRLDNINAEKTVKEIQKIVDRNNNEINKANDKLQEYQKKLDSIDANKEIFVRQAIEDSKLNMNDNDVNIDRRVEENLSKNKDYQKILSEEQKIVDKMGEYSQKIEEAKRNAEKLAKQMKDVKNSASNDLTKGLEKSSNTIEKAGSKLDWLKEKFKKIRDESSKTSKSTNKLGDTVNRVGRKGGNSILKMAMAIFSVRSAYTLLRRASNEYLSTNEQLAGQVQGIWNAIGQAIGPVVEKIIGGIVTMVSYINAFIKALTGIDLVAKGNAAALKKQASATKGVAKETEKAKRQLASFDEMNVLQFGKSSDSGGGSSGSSAPQLQLDSVNIDGIKDKFLEMLEPLKNAWKNYGKDFVDSFQDGLKSIWELMKSIGRSFEEVWLNGTGERTCSLILQIFTNIFDIIGSIADGLNEAWNTAGLGTSIIQNIWDIFNNLLGIVLSLSEMLIYIANQIDWTALLGIIESITGAFSTLLEIISHGLSDIVTCLMSADYSGAGKALSDTFVNAINYITDFIINIDWVQLGIDVANALCDGISAITEFLLGIDWFGLLESIGKLCIEGILAGLSFLVSLVVQVFDNMINAVCDFLGIHSPSKLFEDIGGFILQGLINGLAALGKIVGDLFKGAWNIICSIFSISNVKKFFGDVLAGIKNVFSSIPNWFKSKFTEAWTAVKKVFSAGGKIFDGIKDGILSGLKAVVNAIITGINKVIAIPFNGINSALKSIKKVNILGIKPFDWISTIKVPQIPKLARGGIVNNPGPGVNMGDYIAGERGAEAIVPLENSDFIKSFAKEIASILTEMGQPVNIILKVGDKEFYKWFINLKRKYEFVTNGG